MTQEWLERHAVITVKAYPNPSAKYHETVCVAAITKEEGWIRLYPVQFRTLPQAKRFRKYQRIHLRMKKHERDSRPESYRPDELSIEAQDVIGPEQSWARRWDWIRPTVSTSMCHIQQLQKADGKSIGVFRPKTVLDFIIEDDDQADWSGKKQAALDQMTLFEEQTNRLEKIPMIFKYKYLCSNDACRGHTQSIIDWELMELYRNVRDRAASPEEIKEKIRQKYFDEICGPSKETHFFVGNHSRFPSTFMILGVFWPPLNGKAGGQGPIQKPLFQ